MAHNSADKTAVARIAERLRLQRIEPWFDRWHLTPGDRWQPGIVEGLRAAKSCAVFIGPSGLGDWAREELAVAQDRAAKDPAFRLFMVLLPGAPDPMDPSLAFLTTRTWVDLRNGIADPDGFQDLIAAITGVARRSQVVAGAEPDVCPYRGLESFDAEHSGFFYGREDDTLRVLEKLKASRFVAVIGASGSGKSSLVRAGVVPALGRGALPDSDAWVTRIFAPGARPLSMLAAQLGRLFPQESMGRVVDELRGDERALDLAVTLAMADRPSGERVVMVVDQFEEVFTLCSDEEERSAFLSNLLHAATIPGGRVIVIVALRADFYHHCATHNQLRALVAAQQFLVGPLGPDDLRRAIEEPARQVGIEPEAGLVETILDDVAGRPGTLPLLSHVLLELWNARRGRMLTLEAYVANGGVEGALAARANSIYESLGPEGQGIARRVLLRLTQPGEGTEDTRRRAAMAELVTAPGEQPDVESVVDALARERLVTVGTDEVSGARTVDVTHEALIRGWPLLQGWINEDRELLRAHRRLSEAALEWEESGHDDAHLYRGGRLAVWQDRDLDALNDLERRFLVTSREREAREKSAAQRRAKVAAAALCVALAVISSVAVVAVRQRNQTADQRDLAFARQLAASATAQLPNDPQLSLLLALEAYRAAPIQEAEAVLRQATLESQLRASLQIFDQAYAAHFSPDATRVVIGGAKGTVQVWDWAGDEPPWIIGRHEGSVRAVASSSDGGRVASAGDDGLVRIWDLSGASSPRVLQGHQGIVSDVEFLPDGQHVVSAGTDATVRVWDLSGQAPPRLLPGGESSFHAVEVSPDGAKVVTGSINGEVRIMDLAGGEPMILRGHSALALTVHFSPDGTLVASGSEDTTVRVWAAATGEPRAVFRDHASTVFGVSFSPDGDRVISAALDGTVRIWGLHGGGVQVLRGHTGDVFTASFSPDGHQVLSAGADGRVQVWDLDPSRGTVLRGHRERVVDASFNGDGTRIVTGGEDGVVRVWDLERPGEPVTLHGHRGTIYAVAFAADGRVVSAGKDGTARVWALDRADDPVVLRSHGGTVYDVAFSWDGRQVVSCGDDNIVRVWDPARPDDPLLLPGNSFFVFGCEFSPDGRRVVSAGGDGMVRIWDIARPNEPLVLAGHQVFVFNAVFSADGRQVLTTGGDGTVRIWNSAGDGQPVVLTGHQGVVLTASFRPDGRVLSSGTDGTVRVSDPTGKEPPISLRGPQEGVQRARFSPDGTRVASAGADGTTVVWACEVCRSIEDTLTLARSRVVRELTPEERTTFLHQPARS